MANSFQSHVVSDLCLGKPALKSISISSSLSDALVALKSTEDTFLSVWTCHHRRHTAADDGECRCVGRICMVDILCFLCKDENLASPVSALQSPVSLILPKDSGLVKHVDPSTSLLEAIGLIVEGAQNLIVPIQTNTATYSPRKQASAAPAGPTAASQNYCWLTQEDLLRFILSRIGLFTATAAYSLEELAIIRTDISAVDYHSPAAIALDLLASPLTGQTPVAVVDDEADGVLVGEISPTAFAGADESTAAAVMALSCGDLMAYIDTWGGPPEYLVTAIKSRLKETDSDGLLALLDDDYSSCTFSSTSSSDDDDSTSSSSLMLSRRHSRSGSCPGRRAEEITCHPGSSLVAVMFQAIAHRASYMWVVDDGFGLVGIVTFSDMLEVFYEHMKYMFEEDCLGDEE
ncbi:hypothetical protein V2J09_023701 [Rumex salicifolius]